MTKEFTYKLQGDGRDSWTVTEKDDSGNIVNKYMVYDDPNKVEFPLTDEQLIVAYQRLKELGIIK